MRRLIVNADDLGYTEGVTDGILAAHVNGIVTSASLMVRRSASIDGAHRAAAVGLLDLGLHLDFGEWVYRDGSWHALYQIASLEDARAVAEECAWQLDRFRELVGCNPSHLDSHQHVHRDEPLKTIAQSIARELNIPLRHFSSQVRYCGSFYGQTASGDPVPEVLTAKELTEILREAQGDVIELACHPGWDPSLETMYCREREREVEVLCDPLARFSLAEFGFELSTFSQITWQVLEKDARR